VTFLLRLREAENLVEGYWTAQSKNSPVTRRGLLNPEHKTGPGQMILDASVAAKWFLKGEKYGREIGGVGMRILEQHHTFPKP